VTPGILPFALRVRLRRFKIAPGDVVSLHAGVAARADQRQKLERLCRYISRPAIAEKRLSLTSNGNVRYQLKTPYRDGTTHVIFEPLDFIARLAALVPKPRVNLTRFHGVFAPNSKYRARVTPARRGKGGQRAATDDMDEPTLAEHRAAMTWAQRLKRVLFRASCPSPFGSACGCSKSLPVIWSGSTSTNRQDSRFAQLLAAAKRSGTWRYPMNMPGLRRCGANHRVHRRPGGHREDPRPPGCESAGARSHPAASLPGATAAGAVRLIRII